MHDPVDANFFEWFPIFSLQIGGMLPNEPVENAATVKQLNGGQSGAIGIFIVAHLIEVVDTHIVETFMFEPGNLRK